MKFEKLTFFLALVGCTLLGCDKEPINDYLTKEQIVGQYRITYEAVYNRSNTHYDLDEAGNQVKRDPEYVSYDSQKYNYTYAADGSSKIHIDVSKFRLLLKSDNTVEFYDVANEATLRVEDPKYIVPRMGTWEYEGKNTFLIHLPKVNKSQDPAVPDVFQEVTMYCEVTDNGKYNNAKYLIVKARYEYETAVVKELHLLSDLTIKPWKN